MKFEITKEVVSKYPELMVYLPIIKGFDNTRGRDESKELLRKYEFELRNRFKSVDELLNHPYIKAYFNLFERFGSNPLKVMPTHFALARRVLEGKEIPDINTIVNIYNALSIKYLTPYGGEDLDTVYGDFVLKISKGDEHWKGIGASEGKNPPKGSLIWEDDFDVSTVALNWRQCERTKLSETSKDGYFVMDGFREINDENIRTASQELVDLVTKLCGGEGEVFYIDSEKPFVEIDCVSKNIEGVERPVVEKKVAEDKRVKQVKEKKSYVYQDGTIEKDIQKELSKVVDASQEEILVSQTQNSKYGDYTSPISMNLSSKLKKAPIEIAKEIVEKLTLPKSIEKAEAVMPGYINFFLSKKYIKEEVLKIDNNFGQFKEGENKQVMIEYGQPNTHKSITVGHVKSAITGLSVARLYEAMGYDVIHANYFGDIGPYVAKTLFALCTEVLEDFSLNSLGSEKVDLCLKYLLDFEKEHSLYGLQDEIGRLYVKGSKLSEEDENAKEAIREINSLLFSSENKYINELYKRSRELCIRSQDQFFSILGVKYDRQYPESEVFELGRKIVKGNIGKVFKEDGGAVIFPGEDYGMNNYVFLTSDGNPTYSGKDLGLVNLKFKEYPNMEFCLILTSVEQNDYFNVLMKAISVLYPEKENKYMHIGFGWLLFNNKKTSSRGGTITFSEMYLQAKEAARKKISDLKEYTEDEIERISSAIAIAGIKFNILSHEFYKDINYDPDSFTSLKGYSAPYIIYSYTRAVSILNKADIKTLDNYENVLNDSLEINLMRKLLEFPGVVKISNKNLSTHLMCEYLFDLANTFNSFYTALPILNAQNKDEINARLLLTEKSAKVIKKGLYLLGIDVIEKM